MTVALDLVVEAAVEAGRHTGVEVNARAVALIKPRLALAIPVDAHRVGDALDIAAAAVERVVGRIRAAVLSLDRARWAVVRRRPLQPVRMLSTMLQLRRERD